jgi:hypothetical protein
MLTLRLYAESIFLICDLSVAKYDAPEENSDVYNRNFFAASLLLFDTVRRSVLGLILR